MKRRLLLKLALFTGVLLFAALTVEASYRFYIYGWGGLSPAMMESTIRLARSGVLQVSDEPEIRFELRPDHHRLYKMITHETNSAGLRDRDYSLEKPPGTSRIAFVGDSFTMGHGVEREDIYHEVLERRLNEASQTRNYECINFGVAAYGLFEYGGVIRHRVLDYDPDVIIIALTANDMIPTHQDFHVDLPPDNPFWELHAFDAGWASVVGAFGGEPKRQRRGREGNKLAPGEPHDPWGDDALPPRTLPGTPPLEWDDPLDEKTMTFIREWFATYRQIQDDTGVPIVMVYLTQLFAESPRGAKASQAFAKVAAENQLLYCDTNPYFQGRDVYATIIFKNDTHPNALGHALLADAIHDLLKSGNWIAP